MKLKLLILCFSLILLSGTLSVFGQSRSMIVLNTGLFTEDEFRGVTSTSFMDIPYAYSTAFFLSYRYFIIPHIAIGLSIGTDDVKGHLTYGNPKVTGGYEGTAGNYVRQTYTFAPELFIKYLEEGNKMFYGYIGFGYTYAKLEKAYDVSQYAIAYQNGVRPNPYYLPYYLSAQNPVYVIENHVSTQFTLLGIRTGFKTAWHLEFGYGYKGIINTGLSVKL